MIIREFNKLEEIQKYYDKETNTYIFKEDGKDIDLAIFNFDLRINAHIKAYDIKACDIKAFNIQANGINAWDINAYNIEAWDIIAWNIKAINIKVENIFKSTTINARDIRYHAICLAYSSIKCNSIKGRRDNAKYFVLDGEIEILENGELCEKDLERLEKLEKENQELKEKINNKQIKKIKEDIKIIKKKKKIPKQDLREFIEWQIRYEKIIKNWLDERPFLYVDKEDPTKHLIKIKEWLENE